MDSDSVSNLTPASFPDSFDKSHFIGNTMGKETSGGKRRKSKSKASTKSKSKRQNDKLLIHQMPTFKDEQNLLRYSPQFNGGGEPPLSSDSFSSSFIPNSSPLIGQSNLGMSSTNDGTFIGGKTRKSHKKKRTNRRRKSSCRYKK